MSILIKGSEFPKNCAECWALDEYGDYPVCRITQEQRGYTFRTTEKRMELCPLEETQPQSTLKKIIRHRTCYSGRALISVTGQPYCERIQYEDICYYCNKCGKIQNGEWLNFCDNCGADMRGEAE